MDAVLEDWRTADIPERTRAGLSLLECMTKHPQDLGADFIATIKEAGLDDEAIREAANIGFHYNLINRVADAFNYPVPKGKQTERLAALLNSAGKRIKGSPSNQIWVRGKDDRIRPPEVDIGRERIMTTSGKTASELRYGIDAFVTAQWEHHRKDVPPIPEELHLYLTKLALYAYRITDKDVNALREAGYQNETIYEITLVGSFAAALVGLEQVFAALYEQSAQQLQETAVLVS